MIRDTFDTDRECKAGDGYLAAGCGHSRTCFFCMCPIDDDKPKLESSTGQPICVECDDSIMKEVAQARSEALKDILTPPAWLRNLKP